MAGIPADDGQEIEAFCNALERLGSKREPPPDLFENMKKGIRDLYPEASLQNERTASHTDFIRRERRISSRKMMPYREGNSRSLIAASLLLMEELTRENFLQDERYIEDDPRIEELQNNIHAMELQMAREKIQANKDMLQSMIETAFHLFQRKIDFFQEAIRKLTALMEKRSQELIEEQRQLREMMLNPTLSNTDRVKISVQLRRVSVLIQELQTSYLQMIRELNEKMRPGLL